VLIDTGVPTGQRRPPDHKLPPPEKPLRDGLAQIVGQPVDLDPLGHSPGSGMYARNACAIVAPCTGRAVLHGDRIAGLHLTGL
jgi:hypothetical protein